jgi:hypothetical protein
MWRSPSSTTNTTGLGSSLSWSIDARFCDAILPRFDVESYAYFGYSLLSFVSCEELTDAMLRAFATWSANHERVDFFLIGDACAPGLEAGVNCTVAEVTVEAASLAPSTRPLRLRTDRHGSRRCGCNSIPRQPHVTTWTAPCATSTLGLMRSSCMGSRSGSLRCGSASTCPRFSGRFTCCTASGSSGSARTKRAASVCSMWPRRFLPDGASLCSWWRSHHCTGRLARAWAVPRVLCLSRCRDARGGACPRPAALCVRRARGATAAPCVAALVCVGRAGRDWLYQHHACPLDCTEPH